jgi:hypothetical protein
MPKKQYRLYQNDDTWIPSTSNLSPKMKRIIDDKVQNCIQPNPYGQEPLHFGLDGLRSYNKMETDSRIIFAICEECREKELQTANNCRNCKDIPDDAIMLFAFAGHDFYDKLERQRSKAVEKAKRLRKLRLRGN